LNNRPYASGERFVFDAEVLGAGEHDLTARISGEGSTQLGRSNSWTISIPGEACELTPNPGPCKALFYKYYFNQESNKCESFIWGGCDGLVPFQTLKYCIEECE